MEMVNHTVPYSMAHDRYSEATIRRKLVKPTSVKKMRKAIAALMPILRLTDALTR